MKQSLQAVMSFIIVLLMVLIATLPLLGLSLGIAVRFFEWVK